MSGTFFASTLRTQPYVKKNQNQPMAPLPLTHKRGALRDAIVAVYLNDVSISNVRKHYGVSMKKVNEALISLDETNRSRVISDNGPLEQSYFRNQVYRWASKYVGCRTNQGATLLWEKQFAIIYDVVGQKHSYIKEFYGVGKATLHRYQKKFLFVSGYKSMKLVRKAYKNETLTIEKVYEIVDKCLYDKHKTSSVTDNE